MPFGGFQVLKDRVLQPAKEAGQLAAHRIKSLAGKNNDQSNLVKYDELEEDYLEGEFTTERPGERRPTVNRPYGPQGWTCPCTCCEKCPCGCAKRYVIAILSSLGFLISFGIRCNMGVAIVQMTGNSTSHVDKMRPHKEPEFKWTPEIIGLIDSSFFWGYIVTQIPGGYLASRIPANRVFGIAIGASAFLNLLIPGACKVHYGLVMAVRILQGLVEGVTYPAVHGIWRHWAPPLERSRLATISFCGSYAGAVVGMPLSGVLTDYLGWQSCFYFYGAIGMVWSIV